MLPWWPALRDRLLQVAARGGLGLLRQAWLRMGPAERRWFLRHAVAENGSAEARHNAGLFQEALAAWRQPWTLSHARYDLAANGEEELLRRLGRFAPHVVLDVGANVGQWALLAHRHMPEATIHCFEIAPATADVLQAAVQQAAPRILVNRIGLADRAGEVVIHADPDHSDYTTILEGGMNIEDDGDRARFAATAARIVAPVTTGDLYLASAGITAVDLLKIDVEGAERLVLQGFSGALARGAVHAIQLEYNAANIGARFLLADIHAMLEPHGFAIGRLDPRGVAFKAYTWRDEDFNGPNIVAVHRSRAEVMQALAATPLDAL